MSYLDKLSPAQKNNMTLLVNEMNAEGITNPLTHAAVLAVVYKESAFNPAASEISYKNTDNARIRSVFAKTKSLSDADLNKLKSDNKSFFDFVYEPRGIFFL